MSSEDVDVIRDDNEVMVVDSNTVNTVPVKTKHKIKSKKKSKTKDLKKSKNLGEVNSKSDYTTSQSFSVYENISVHKDNKSSKKVKKQKKLKRKKPEDVNLLESDDTISKVVSPPKKKAKFKTKKKLVDDSDLLYSLKSTTPPRATEADTMTPESLHDFDLKADWKSKQDLISSPKKNTQRDRKIKSPSKRLMLDDNFDAKPSKSYDSMLSLSWPPRINDLIAFKLLEMAEDYSPVISEFQEGVVRALDGTAPESAVLELEMLGGPSKMRRSGRFELGLDDTSDETIKEISWSRLIDPKLVINDD